MEDADIYYVDTRNSDHRVHGRPVTPTRAIAVPSASAPRVIYAGPTSMGYPNAPFYGQPPVYSQPPVYGPPPVMGMLGALFGGINIGQVIDLVGQGFAALKALPAAPSSTGDVTTDVANLTLYQRSLAEHGKLDEQIRTGVHIVAKLLGA
jgi:hypothetical protein